MKKFKGMKKLNDIIKDAKKIGFEVDTDSFDNGGDYIYLRDVNERMEQIALNTFNGQFFIYTPDTDDPNVPYATHLSDEFENEDWYEEKLNLFYEPLNDYMKKTFYVIQTGVRSIKYLRDSIHFLKLVDDISDATLCATNEIAEQYLDVPFLKSKSNVKIIEVEVEYRITKEL